MLPILLALAFIAILIFILIAGQPDEFNVTRAATLAAPPETIFPHVNDLHLWQAWSPWAKLDPNCQNTFSGAATGWPFGFDPRMISISCCAWKEAVGN